MEYLIVIYKTVIFYILITVLYRLMGKREIGELSIMDLTISILLAEFAAISIDNVKENMLLSILPMIILVLIQFGYSKFSLHNKEARSVLEGEPSVIINRGIVNFKEMTKQRYNIDDLLKALRDKSIKSLEEVDFALLENNGSLSVFTKGKEGSVYPLPVIVEGNILEDTLRQIKKDKKWLLNRLEIENYQLEDVFYAFYRNNSLFLIKKENIK